MSKKLSNTVKILTLIPAVGETFVDPENANLAWRVLADYNGYALLITENVWSLGQEETWGHANNRWNETNVFRQFENAYLRRGGHLGNWYQNTVGATIRSRAVNYGFVPLDNLNDDLITGIHRAKPGVGIEFDATDNSNAGLPTDWADGWRCNRAQAFSVACQWTRAISRPTGNEGQGQPFVLSQTEVQTFFGPDNANPANWDRQAFGGMPQGWGFNSSRSWWLRSPGTSYSPLSIVGGDFNHGGADGGFLSTSDADFIGSMHGSGTGIGVRPALWVMR